MVQDGKRSRSWRGGFLVIAAVLAACATKIDDVAAPVPSPEAAASSSPAGPAPAVSKVVGSEGGTVVNATGSGVEVPAGAVPADVQVSVQSAPDEPPPSGATSLGTPTVFEPNGIQFAKPVTVIIAFDPARLPAGTDPSNVVVMTAPDGSSTYEILKTTLRDATHVAAETTHFCIMQAVVPPSCSPVACGDRCGAISDECGGKLDCGPCDSGATSGDVPDASTNEGGKEAGAIEPQGGGDGGTTSGDGGASKPDAGGSCQTLLCGSYGPGACGMLDNGCGGSMDCGKCGDTQPTSDAGTGTGGADGGSCMALTCDNYVGKCGMLPNGCNGWLDCGACEPSDGGAPSGDGGATTMDGGGAGGGCMPMTCKQGMCGSFPDDGCGKPLDCGACEPSDGGSSGGGGAPSDGGTSDGGASSGGGCMPMTCKQGMCGTFPDDGCGKPLDCGPCPP